MDVLTEEALRVRVGSTASRLALPAAVLAYAGVVFAAILHHEPWADEAQSWLLARDASLWDLWTRLLHYEGTTGLWQTLLHGLIRAGMPYAGMSLLSGFVGLAGAGVLLWRAPFPLAIRIALPFTFFLCYQYAVIARSYSLLPLLLFGCASLYESAAERRALFTVVLCLMAAVSVHGMALAVAVGGSALVSSRDRKRLAVPAICFAAFLGLLAVAARPAHDGTFTKGLNLSFTHFLEVSAKAFATAFTGEWLTSLAVVGISIPLLCRGGGWLFFLIAGGLLSAISSLVYSQVWHHGVLLLAWLFALWISWGKQRPHSTGALVSLGIIAALQCYWTACSIAYDWRHAYSASREAAQTLVQLERQGQKLYAVGFACVAIQPYFPVNIYANLNDGRPEAYWDWSRRNHVNGDSLHLSESRPDLVIVGYKNDFERGVWAGLVKKSGYRVLRHFEGNTFWQTRIFEPESYDLYERGHEP